MKTIVAVEHFARLAALRLALCFVLGALLLPVGLPGQDRAAPSAAPNPAAPTSGADTSLVFSNAAVLSLLTNFSRLAERLGLDLQVDKLTLDLNGFALVGFHNSLTNLTAQQQIIRPDSPADVGKPSAPPVSTGTTALSNACLVLNGLSLALATNVSVGVENKAFRVRVGSLLLRLNGFALVGVTNSLDGLTAQQELPPPSPPESSPPPPRPAPPATKPEQTKNR